MEKIERFWRDFIQAYPGGYALDTPYSVEQLGNDPEEADEEVRLILEGVKRTACGVLWEWDLERMSFPETGQITVVLDGLGEPRCIIRAREITIMSFNEMPRHYVEQGFADERAVAQFCDAYWRYFTQSLAKIGRKPTPTMPVVCEEFDVLYAPELTQLDVTETELAP